MSTNSPLNENEKGQISTNKLEGKSMFHCKITVEVSNRNYLKGPELYGARKRPDHPPKITNTSRR